MEKIEPRLLKGFRDYGPEEQLARQTMFLKIQSVFERFGFLPMSTPVLEYKEILTGKIGEDEKLIYSFKDNGGRDVAMRDDLTVSLARYAAQNQNQISFPFKRYMIAPVWRADNPQKGRLREFYQCDIDAVGTDSPLADAEIVACVYQALAALGLQGKLKIRFNNRMLFGRLLSVREEEQSEIMRGIDKLDKIGKQAVLELLEDRAVSEQGRDLAGKIIDAGKGTEAIENIPHLFPDAADVVSAVKGFQNAVESFGVPSEAILFDPTIVRGLEYYTNMVFETLLEGKPEYGSIASGGRYDGLLSGFSDQSMGAVGGSIGIDRLFGALKELDLLPNSSVIKVLVLQLDEKYQSQALQMVSNLREHGINAELYYAPAKLDKQFKYAESKNIPYAIIIGEAEAEKGTAQLKNLKTRTQEELPQTMIIKQLIQEQE